MTNRKIIILFLLIACAIVRSSAQQFDIDSSHSELRPVIERFQADRDALSRSYSVALSPERSSRMKGLLGEALDALNALNFGALSSDGRIDYLLFRNYLNRELRRMHLRSKSDAEAGSLLPFAGSIIALEDSRRRMDSIDAEALAGLLTRLGKQIDSTRDAIDSAKRSATAAHPFATKRTIANRAASTVKDLNTLLKHWFEYYNGYDPIFTWWVREPYKAVSEKLTQYGDFLKEKIAGIKPDDTAAIIGDPIGREALLSELSFEMIPYTPEDLIAIAHAEYEWCETEMKKASHELGYGDDWKKALEHVKEQHVDPGKQPELVRTLALEAIRFVDDHDLVTIPQLARDTWRMEMLTPEQQLQSPFFLGGEVIRVAFPTGDMRHEQKMMSMRGNNIHFARATVFHELIPGHHLQGFMNDRFKPYRQLFYTPFAIEGGALYWEIVFWDLGFPKTPENKIGMLFWRMHRCARIVFSLNYHLEKMSPQECIDFLVEKVGHERENAAAEVRRSIMGGYGPLYQCAYMLGALQLRALRKELVDAGTITDRQFHDAILHENAIPIELLRARLTGQNLSKDFTSSWKFYGNKVTKE